MAVAGRLSGPEWKKYADPATELDVLRLTDPAFSSGLTAPHLRQFGRRGDTLLYWSERFGARQAFLLDLKTGDSHQVTEAAALDAANISLSADDRGVLYFDGPSLMKANWGAGTCANCTEWPRARCGRAFQSPLTVRPLYRTRRRSFEASAPAAGAVSTVAETQGDIDFMVARPHYTQALYRESSAWWLVNLDGTGKGALPLEPGRSAGAVWRSPGGRCSICMFPTM